jgi:hypothetical protein
MPRYAFLCCLTACALAGGAALAQTPTPQPRPATVPQKDPPAGNLSEQLNNSNGVIHPKEVDPGIEKPAPKVDDPNVIPPGAAAPKAK